VFPVGVFPSRFPVKIPKAYAFITSPMSAVCLASRVLLGRRDNSSNNNNNNNSIQFLIYLRAELNSQWPITESEQVQTTALRQHRTKQTKNNRT
jgi:hypothetical protein